MDASSLSSMCHNMVKILLLLLRPKAVTPTHAAQGSETYLTTSSDCAVSSSLDKTTTQGCLVSPWSDGRQLLANPGRDGTHY